MRVVATTGWLVGLGVAAYGLMLLMAAAVAAFLWRRSPARQASARQA
jgi:Na+/phosphate symporter